MGGHKFSSVLLSLLLGLVLIAATSRAQNSGYVPPPRGAPDNRSGAASRETIGAERRVALVIGNGSYRHLPRLTNPENDADLMAKTLKSLGFEVVGGGAQIDLDRAGFEHAVREFGSELSQGAVGLFYYAGHGVQVAGENYLVPVGANPTSTADVGFELIDAGLVIKEMEVAGSRLNFVILDACRNNPLAGRGVRDAARGLAQIAAPSGTLISYATQPGNVAKDGTGAHSPYTQALVDAMQRPGLGIFEVFNTAAVAVKNATGGDQQPWVSSSPISGDFFFAEQAGTSTQGAKADSLNPEPRQGFDEWTIFGIARDANIPSYMRLSSIHQVGNRKFVVLQKAPADKDFPKNIPDANYQETREVYDCKDSVFYASEVTVFSKEDNELYHYKYAIPEVVDTIVEPTKIQEGSIAAAAQAIVCNDQLSTPTVDKRRLLALDFKSLASTPQGDGELFYDTTGRTDGVQPYALLIAKYDSEKPMIGNLSSFKFTFISQLFQMDCPAEKFRSIKQEYYGSTGDLELIEVAPLSTAGSGWLDIIKKSPAALLRQLICPTTTSR